MELVNALYKFDDQSETGRAVMQEALEMIALTMSPIVPHITHSMWQGLGHKTAVVDASWPEVDAQALTQDEIELVVQVNGKVRGRIKVPAGAADALIRDVALADENVQRFVADKEVKKIIVVQGKLVSIVVGG
jgi:leucyl-tRNA synthetase